MPMTSASRQDPFKVYLQHCSSFHFESWCITCDSANILVVLFGEEEICQLPFTAEPLKHIEVDPRHQSQPGACCVTDRVDFTQEEIGIRNLEFEELLDAGVAREVKHRQQTGL